MAKKATRTRAAAQRGGASSYRILSLDGGGIRGVMTAVWLAELEKRLKGRAADHFDLIAGTSTGSILACALAKRISAADIVNLYEEKGRDIFPGMAERLWSRTARVFSHGPSAPKYSDAGLQNTLRRQLGEVRFADLDNKGRSPRILVTSYNTLTREAVVFKSWYSEHAHVPLWEAVKASCSAPTYFPAHLSGVLGGIAPLIDGGVVANNPTACAIAEAVRLHTRPHPGDDEADVSNGARAEIKDFVVGSFGTGESTRPIEAAQAREWGALEWAVPIINVLMDGAADATHYIATQLLAKDRYIRLDTTLDTAFDDMDDASSTNIKALVGLARGYLRKEGGERLDHLVRLVK